MLQKKL